MSFDSQLSGLRPLTCSLRTFDRNVACHERVFGLREQDEGESNGGVRYVNVRTLLLWLAAAFAYAGAMAAAPASTDRAAAA